MNFEKALEALKNGKLVTRNGWNGKGMFLWLKPASIIKAEWCKDEILKSIVEENGGEMEANAVICMKTADNKITTGWVASQPDMMAEDWMVFNGKTENDDWNYNGIRYFRANVSPVSFEDGDVNGESDDDDNPRIPCIDKDGRWNILIDIKDGKILNWEKGTTAEVYYKVVDDGIYTVYDNNMNVVKEKDGYVPKIMDFNDRDGSYGFGDYLGLEIDENGNIIDWPKKRIGWFINDFIKSKY